MHRSHSERLDLQDRAIEQCEEIRDACADDFRPLAQAALDRAHQLYKVLETYGRQPHRNRVLGREDTPAEAAWRASHDGPLDSGWSRWVPDS